MLPTAAAEDTVIIRSDDQMHFISLMQKIATTLSWINTPLSSVEGSGAGLDSITVSADKMIKQSIFTAAQNVCFWHKADNCLRCGNVRFWG